MTGFAGNSTIARRRPSLVCSEKALGLKAGLSAENYISMPRTSRATATRNLHDLVVKDALTRTGAGRLVMR